MAGGRKRPGFMTYERLGLRKLSGDAHPSGGLARTIHFRESVLVEVIDWCGLSRPLINSHHVADIAGACGVGPDHPLQVLRGNSGPDRKGEEVDDFFAVRSEKMRSKDVL